MDTPPHHRPSPWQQFAHFTCNLHDNNVHTSHPMTAISCTYTPCHTKPHHMQSPWQQCAYPHIIPMTAISCTFCHTKPHHMESPWQLYAYPYIIPMTAISCTPCHTKPHHIAISDNMFPFSRSLCLSEDTVFWRGHNTDTAELGYSEYTRKTASNGRWRLLRRR